MRLTELNKPREIDTIRKTWQNSDKIDKDVKVSQTQATQMLQKYGFQVAGKGKFGSVFISPDYPFALKVFRKDHGYIGWLQFCRENQENPWVPKLKGKMVRITSDIFAARIEKLAPLEKSPQNYEIIEELQDLLNYKDEDTEDPDLHIIMNFFDDLGVGIFVDIHIENVMKRTNGQWVLVDPLGDAFQL